MGIPNPKIKPFGFYSQKVLPLVYDDSLSYYEVLGKVTHKLNDLITIINDKLDDYIRAQLDDLFLNAMYDPETETLILSLEIRDS